MAEVRFDGEAVAIEKPIRMNEDTIDKVKGFDGDVMNYVVEFGGTARY